MEFYRTQKLKESINISQVHNSIYLSFMHYNFVFDRANQLTADKLQNRIFICQPKNRIQTNKEIMAHQKSINKIIQNGRYFYMN